ncbi:MAG: sigma-54 dependent transcriptional regulator, partial [Bacteroidota bacterium]
ASHKLEIRQSVENRLSGMLPNLLRMSVVLSASEHSEPLAYFEDETDPLSFASDSGPFLLFLLSQETMQSASVNDLLADFKESSLLNRMMQSGTLFLVTLPFIVSGGKKGVALLEFSGVPSLSPSVGVLEGVAELLSMAISNMMADEQIGRSQALQRLQLDLANSLNNRASVQQQMQDIISVLESGFVFDTAVVYLQMEEQQRMLVFHKVGFDEYQVLDESSLLQVMQAKNALPESFFPDFSDEVHVASAEGQGLRQQFLDRYGIRSLLHLPISHGPSDHFALELYAKAPDTFGPDKRDLASRLRSTLRLLLDNILAFEAINDLTDELQNEKQYLVEELESSFRLDGMTSHSDRMQQVIARIETVATTDASVLIQGETGTGKELTARAIHRNSDRRDKAFIKINCAAIPAQLIESELFGHEKGAFTGAHDRRIGKFELAHKGTLFLDEIGEMPLDLQPKLLRALQEGEFERLGSNKTLQADIRLICATNRNLTEEVAQATFRADLFYRISVFPIDLPRLYDRGEDIAPLARQFALEICEKQGSHFIGFDESTLENFNAYEWPGNIRELRNVVEQLCILYRNQWMHWESPSKGPGLVSGSPARDSELKDLKSNILLQERESILLALRKTGGRIRGAQGAASMLGMKPTTLEYRIRKLEISKDEIYGP